MVDLGPYVIRALAEDCASQDITTQLLGATASEITEARFDAESRCIVAGVPVVAAVFQELDPSATITAAVEEGSAVASGATIATVRAPARMLLAGERVALNFLQRLCGIATITRRAVAAVRGTGAQITHTRKTTPGLRTLELYAVGVGGGVPNRTSLADAVLWKDNHWALLARNGGSSLQAALRDVPRDDRLVVEIESEAQLDEALAAGVTHLLVDNQSPERVAAWARRAGPNVKIQASGGITPENARAYAEAGAALIAIGALTHSAPAASIRCEITGQGSRASVADPDPAARRP
ncbi:MAG TPA: carboxylating nicotinate-nucleotide diphosphorylase [Gemmatimonadales bacterium]|nr:carboxylating nicotinate-nucleotide diphosphorylase [Gemmatimonadales bacterium]